MRSQHQQKKDAEASFFCWCEKRDLNPYGVNHTPLKRARLPVPPLSHLPSLLRRLPYYTLLLSVCQYFFESFFEKFSLFLFLIKSGKNRRLCLWISPQKQYRRHVFLLQFKGLYRFYRASKLGRLTFAFGNDLAEREESIFAVEPYSCANGQISAYLRLIYLTSAS